MDIASIVGIILGLTGIIGGNAAEGHSVANLLNAAAPIIVFGGSIGAAILQFTPATLKRSVKDLKEVFKPTQLGALETIKQLVTIANKARREGIVAIERDVEALPDPFLKKALNLAVDGTDSKGLRAAMEVELETYDEEGEEPSKVWEAVGAYLPTLGIVGAVMGLIATMQNITDPNAVGRGVAVAFTATLYGVGSANILFLLIAGKMKSRHKEKVKVKALMLEGVISIVEGENPRLIEEKLRGFLPEADRAAAAAEAAAGKGGEAVRRAA